MNLIPLAGHVQSGFRPAVIMSEEIHNIVWVVPLTSNLRALKYNYTLLLEPTGGNGLDTKSVALVFHLRAIDTKYLVKRLGTIEESYYSKILNMIENILG